MPIRKSVILKIVVNYRHQILIAEKSDISIRDYLQGIKDGFSDMTQEEIEYGVKIYEETLRDVSK